MHTAAHRRRRRRNFSPASLVLLVIFGCVFCVSGFFLIQYFLRAAEAKNTFTALQKMTQATVSDVATDANSGQAAPKEIGAPEDLSALAAINNDMVGWLFIADTKINYPVMCTPQAPEYYLRRDFYGQYSLNGVPFIGPENNEESDNVIIYGHNMQDGSMFADIMRYEEKSFFENHDTLRFDTLNEKKEYEIFAVLKTEIASGKFPYYSYTNFSDAEAFNTFVSEVTRLSLYSTGRTTSYGDALVTLSTCSYHATDGRLVVVAKEKKTV